MGFKSNAAISEGPRKPWPGAVHACNRAHPIPALADSLWRLRCRIVGGMPKSIRAPVPNSTLPQMADELRAAAEAADAIDPRLAEKLRDAAKVANELAAVMRAALGGFRTR